MGATKTVSGAYVNSLAVPSQNLPGNFGARVVDSMPMTLFEAGFRERKTMPLDFTCLEEV